MARARLLIVDDKENMLKLLERTLGHEYDLTTAADGARALSLVALSEFDVVVTDIRMPGANGFEVLKAVKSRSPSAEVILMTGYAAVQDAVAAMKQGAYDYLEKPFDPDAAALVISRALERKQLKEQAAILRKEVEGVFAFHNIVGKSAAMREVYGLLDRASDLDINILLTGETGTGKELVARAIHYHSARKERRFIPVNCGALPSELIESELFGHVRGAFTGAGAQKAGLFEEAAGGTIFLDEVGELPLSAQVKLNRVLQEKEIRRVGDNRATSIDVRTIAATHRDLKAEAEAGRFRQDLFYRLHVFPIRLPPLRERREDIPLLAAHFLEKHARAFRREVEEFEPDALREFAGYRWPGNVRELENAVERAVAVARTKTIGVGDLPPELRGNDEGGLPPDLAKMPYRDVVDLARDRVSREYLIALLREFSGNVTQAAARAGMERESLHRLLKRYQLRSDRFKRRS
ncbi:MAG TPA: sigma-54 dependent transcriptional regulator [Anaeromyxobacteraceae bacterium]|nr:sigma-54 dependent transcriptional regulator [Anaeromyxobacteraceae bacterium]